jgi:Tol biopolymer transport system component
LAALAILPLTAVGGWLLWQRSVVPAPAPRVKVLTSYPGFEMQPNLSPDGSQVAFVWGGPTNDNFDVYIKLVGSENPLRLTTDLAYDGGPSWSPDGKRIAFLRFATGRIPAVYLISPLGGDEQKVADVPDAGGYPLSWSPDGKWLTFAHFGGDSAGVYLLPVDGGPPRRVTSPKPPASDSYPVFTPDGRRLAYADCTRTFSCDLYVMELDSAYAPQGQPRRITQQQLYAKGIAWAGDSLVYGGSLSWGLLHYLWRVKADGASAPERMDIAGVHASEPTVSRLSDRLVFARFVGDHDITRYQIGGSQAPLITSTMDDVNPQFSPDGNRITFSTSRSGEAYNIWVAEADGSNPAQLVHQLGRSEGAPKWSPDGRWIAFDSLRPDGYSDIFVIDVTGGRPRRLELGSHENAVPSWSRDGKWIYFLSDRTGRREIWKVPSAGGQVEQVTENGGFFALESTDGNTLFYTKAPSGTPLFAKPVNGGPERKVLDYVGQCRAFVVFEDGVYYCGKREREQNPLLFHQFSSATSRLITTVDGFLLNGLTVSPDRRTILYTRSVSSGGDLMLIENFR